MRGLNGLLAAGAAAAVMGFWASGASAATIIDNMGELNPFSSVNGSVTLTYIAPKTVKKVTKPGSLKYSFGATGAEAAFSTTQSQNTGVLNMAFEFEVGGEGLKLVNADAINPLAGGKQLGGLAPEIYVTDGLGGPVVLGPSAFTFDALLNSFDAATGSVTLAPGNYYEYVVGTAKPGVTKINVGAFAGAAVPEPATWAMMLMGVGMIGAGLRMGRRRDQTALFAA